MLKEPSIIQMLSQSQKKQGRKQNQSRIRKRH